MEESLGETLSEKMGDFDEVVPDIGASEIDLDQVEVNGDVYPDAADVVPEKEPAEGGEKEEDLEHSPVSNGHSIVTEATIEAHDMTDLDQSVIVSSVLLLVWRCS